MIERDFDVPFVAEMALREKQIQQNYRPIIAVHKWFARRPGSLFRSLLLAEFGSGPLRERYFEANDLRGIRVADPFMGGGTPLLEANRLGCDVLGYDINPMAYWIVREEIECLDLVAYRDAAQKLVQDLTSKIGSLYKTKCLHCGSTDASAKYYLWVKTKVCQACGNSIDLFPGFLISEDRRHPKNVFVCAQCGDLTETEDRKNPGRCRSCGAPLHRSGPANRNRCKCPHCGLINTYPDPKAGPPEHRMFAIEYHCPRCKPRHEGRFFKTPDVEDLAKYSAAVAAWKGMSPVFVPDDEIPPGDETHRLHRWGYRHYREMFNARQLLGLEISCRAIAEHVDERVRNALATNLSDLLRYQNMLCRYDTVALKSLDIFSIHGYPVGLVQCESNLLGIPDNRQGVNVGSGGWANIIEKYAKAKAYCENPFEVQYRGGRKILVPVRGEWIGEWRNGAREPEHRSVVLRCESTTSADLPPGSLDAVLTDPPYFANVQYAELIDFCYVWLRRLVSVHVDIFQSSTTRNANELTGNATMERGLSHFTEGLSEVFCRMAKALKPGAPFVFTYHHNSLDAYYPIAVSILDAGLTCSASIPCPAEMGASIHINGTTSSIVDTIFVCRSTGRVPSRWIAQTPEGTAALVADDIEHLRSGNVAPTRGDIRCVIFGHLIRLAVWRLRGSWNKERPTSARILAVASQIRDFGSPEEVERCLGDSLFLAPALQCARVREQEVSYSVNYDEVSF